MNSFNNKQGYSVWIPSPCSTPHWEGSLPIDKSQRFCHNSIYTMAKSQPKINHKSQIIRPESVFLQFRRKISQCEKASRKVCKYVEAFKNNLLNSNLKKMSKSKPKIKLNRRLYSQTPHIMDREFDRNGMRSTFYTVNQQDQKSKKFKLKKNRSVLPQKKKFTGPKVYVSGSMRMDLARPYNFHPGPGAYFLDKIDKDAQVLYEDNQNYDEFDESSCTIEKTQQIFQTRSSTQKAIQQANQQNQTKNRKIQIIKKSKTIYQASNKFAKFFQ